MTEPPRPPPPQRQTSQATQSSSSRKRPYKPKVKTGCTSCRIRRVKCDEGKPSCQRCLSTGRTCDGYEDLFRLVQWTPNQTPASPVTAEPPAKVPRRTPPSRSNSEAPAAQQGGRQGHEQPFVIVQQSVAPPVHLPNGHAPLPTSWAPVKFEAAEPYSPVAPPPPGPRRSSSSRPSAPATPRPPVSAPPTTSGRPSFSQPLTSRPAQPQPHPPSHHLAAISLPPQPAPQIPFPGIVSPVATHRLPYYPDPDPDPKPGPFPSHSTPSFLPHPSYRRPSLSDPIPPPPPGAPSLTANDIAALAARFTNKPTPGGYGEEARATLEASLSEPAVRHALASLSSLYRTLEEHGHEFPRGTRAGAVPAVYHGLQEYNNAIVNLATKLSVMDRRSCEVALVCCRLFISIETMQRDYVSVAKHYIRGMRIMHEAATRPYLDAWGNVIPTQNGDFPKLDVFVFKLFMSPDKVSPALRTAAIQKPKVPRERSMAYRRRHAHRYMRLIRLARNEVRAARVKAKLLIVSELAIQHFENVSRLRPGSDPSGVVRGKEILLGMLEALDLDRRDGARDLGAYHGRFHFLFGCGLRIGLTLSLWPPTRDIGELQPIFDRVAQVSGHVI